MRKKRIGKLCGCALLGIMLAGFSVMPASAATQGEPSGRNVYFTTGCYYNRTFDHTSNHASVNLKLFKNSTTKTDFTSNPQVLYVDSKVYYLNSQGNVAADSLTVSSNGRQTTVIGSSVSSHKYLSGNATYCVAANKGGETLHWV